MAIPESRCKPFSHRDGVVLLTASSHHHGSMETARVDKDRPTTGGRQLTCYETRETIPTNGSSNYHSRTDTTSHTTNRAGSKSGCCKGYIGRTRISIDRHPRPVQAGGTVVSSFEKKRETLKSKDESYFSCQSQSVLRAPSEADSLIMMSTEKEVGVVWVVVMLLFHAIMQQVVA